MYLKLYIIYHVTALATLHVPFPTFVKHAYESVVRIYILRHCMSAFYTSLDGNILRLA